MVYRSTSSQSISASKGSERPSSWRPQIAAKAPRARSPEEYEAEIAALKAEIDQLKVKTALTMFGGTQVPSSVGAHTILGLEEMVIIITTEDTVSYVNTTMMRLLGIGDRKLALGTPVARWDKGPLGENTLAALIQMARSADQPQAVERSFPDLPAELLPQSDGPGGNERILRFTVSSQQGPVQIIAQDVTRIRWLESTFSRYLSPQVIEQMQQTQAGDLLSMERVELTIVFSDLRGFTSLCQSATPEVVQETINSFLSNMVGCIEALAGTVQGFIGDEVMAIFGAPLPLQDHALRGLVCGVEMQRVHCQWMAERQAAKKPAPPVGVGLATGVVVVGNVGTETRMVYTAQGHGVNLAARLCGAARAGEVLTVPRTHQAAMKSLKGYQGEVPIPRLGFASKGKLRFKNVTDPVEVLEVRIKG